MGFKGNNNSMKDNVFQCHRENTDKQQPSSSRQWLGVLEVHINKTFIYPQEMASICKSFGIASAASAAREVDKGRI